MTVQDSGTVLHTPSELSDSSNAADTYDWDTAFGITFKDANAAIIAKNSSPPSFTGSWSDPFSGDPFDVTGNFGAWQLSGGAGSIVHMNLPIKSGAITPHTGGTVDQYNGMATVEVYLNFLPQPDTEGAGSTKGQVNNLVVKTTTEGANGQPVASVQDFSFGPDSPWSVSADPVKAALQTWLNSNLQDFNHVFSVVVVNETADQGAFQWLKPTLLGYAVNSPTGQPVDNYVLGVMAMTEGRTNPNLSYEISPNIIPSGVNAGFLISQDRFVEKIIMPGVYLIFSGASAADFDTTNDGTTVTNIQPLTFQNFVLEDGTVITDAAVDTGNFTLTAFDTSLELQFTDLHFTWQPGYIVHLNYTGFSKLYLDDNHNFQMTEVSKPTLTTMVTKTTAEQWKELIVGIVEGIALAVVGAVIGGALGPAADAAGDAASDAAADGADAADATGSDAMNFDVEGVLPEETTNPDAVESENNSDASEDLAHADDDSYQSKFKGWFGRNWSKLLGSVIGSAVGVVVAKLPDILEAYAEKDLKDMPTLDDFADEAVAPTTWPNSSGYSLVSIDLSRSLQMGLDVKFTS